jgi:hypothetical protein
MTARIGRRAPFLRIASAVAGVALALVLVVASLSIAPQNHAVALWVANGDETEPLNWSSGPSGTTIDNQSSEAGFAFPLAAAHFAVLGDRTNSTVELNLSGSLINGPSGPVILFDVIVSGRVAASIAPTSVTIAATATNVSGYAPGIWWTSWWAGENVSSAEPDPLGLHDQSGPGNGSAWVRTDLGNQSRPWNGHPPDWYFFEVDAGAMMQNQRVSGWPGSTGQYLFEVTLNGLSEAVVCAVDVHMNHTTYS